MSAPDIPISPKGALVALLVVILVYRFLLYPSLLSPLAKIPNAHWSAPISRAWILWIRRTHRENRTLLAAHRRLGPVVRVGPNDLSINDVDSVRTVYQGGFEKHRWYDVFDNYGVPCMFSARSNRDHSARKRMISNVYSKSYIQASAAASAQARHILFERLLPVLFESAHPSQTPRGIEIHSLFLATTMDFISAYIFGIKNSTDFLRNKGYRDHWLELYLSRHDHPFFPQELPLVTSVLRLSFLQPLLVWLGLDLKLYPSWVDAANRELEAWNMEICGRAIEYLKSTSPMQPQQDAAYEPVVLRALLSGIDKERRSHADQQNKYESPLAATVLCHQDRSVASELFDHVLAGQETAGVALTYITWHLSRRPDLQDELRSELLTLSPSLRFEDNGDGSSRAAAGMGAPDALPNLRHLDALPLLHAIVTETLRLNAPLPGPQPRVTPSPGCVLGGAESKRFWVPGAVRIAALAHALHRDEDVFEAAETWEPRRWLPPRSAGEQDRKGNEAETGDGEAEDRRREMNRRFWAFGSGGRMCIGSHFAMHEMKLIVAAIYSNFTTHIVDDDGIEQSDGYTARPTSDRLYVRLEKV